MRRIARRGVWIGGWVVLGAAAGCGQQRSSPATGEEPAAAAPQAAATDTAVAPESRVCDDFSPQWGQSADHRNPNYTLRLFTEQRSTESEDFSQGRVIAKVEVVAGRLQAGGFDVPAGQRFCVLVQGDYQRRQLTARFIPFRNATAVLPGPVGVRLQIKQQPHAPHAEWIEEYHTDAKGTLLSANGDADAADTSFRSTAVRLMQGSCGGRGCCSPKKAL